MGRMQIVLSDELEKKLRREAYVNFGFKKGAISKAIEQAIENWLKNK